MANLFVKCSLVFQTWCGPRCYPH